MSTPRCLRIAIEACRPQKSSSLALRPRFTSTHYPRRTFCTSKLVYEKDNKDKPANAPTGAVDITSGFTVPEPGAITISDGLSDNEPPQELKEDDDESWNEQFKIASTNSTPATEELQPEVTSQTQTTQVQQPTSRSSASSDASPSPREKTQTAPSRKSSKSDIQPAPSTNLTSTAPEIDESNPPNVPPNVLAAYRTPLYHPMTHGIPVAQLQLRSFSVRNIEFFADFCVRAAYYLSLPVTGPTPLPRKTERWTVLKSNFVNKKAQENFERITMKRLITVYDGNPEVVETWLAFVRRWQYHGVGMKANVWGYEGLDVAGKMDADFANLEAELDSKLRLFGFNKHVADNRDLLGLMERQNHRREGMGMTELREKARVKDSDPW